MYLPRVRELSVAYEHLLAGAAGLVLNPASTERTMLTPIINETLVFRRGE